MKYCNKIIITIAFLCFLLLGSQCKKDLNLSKIPNIQFLKFSKLSSPSDDISKRGIIIFSYTDGDGNIGLSQGDTTGVFSKGNEYYYNLWITYQEYQNGTWKDVEIQDIQTGEISYLHSRIPMLTKTPIGQAIKGEIIDTIPIYNPVSKYDTIRFLIQIADRNLNKSNQISTPMIIR